MNYCYDIILNWNEENVYNFYEWNDTDYLELIKKIPLFKVKHKTFLEAFSNNIKVNSEFLTLIKDKTLFSTKKMLSKLDYACLISDGKNVLALEFNNEGYALNRSVLLIDDELQVLEVCYNLKEYDLELELLNPLKQDKTLRQIKDAKSLIALEIRTLYQKEDISKLKYLYYEYQKETLDNLKEIYDKIINDLNEEFNSKLLKLYYIIKLSYHNV